MSMKVLLVGSGLMAKEYVKVLEGLNAPFDVVGRSDASAQAFTAETGHKVYTGGLEAFVRSADIGVYSHFIVATNVTSLYGNVECLLQAGAKGILVEKPCVLAEEQLNSLCSLASVKQADVFIAYNRRFFASVLKAKEIIEQDGGLEMVKFDFTEWSHIIETLEKDPLEKERWLLANSTHIIDLAFFFAGKPVELSTYVEDGLAWHLAGKIFTGAGKSETGVLFSYGSDWGSAGRWWLELFTKERKLSLCPVEQLNETLKGTVVEKAVEIDDSLDKQYKPGVFLQVEAFLGKNDSQLLDLHGLNKVFSCYCRIAGYE